jgi:DNA (cytosine-5)-methyltransferase 1
MNLYQEIIFLEKRFNGLFCVENVRSYYEPLIKPYVIDRHYFWANFFISPFRVKRDFSVANARKTTRLTEEEYVHRLKTLHGFDINDVKLLRNCVYPPLGKHILDCGLRATQSTL